MGCAEPFAMKRAQPGSRAMKVTLQRLLHSVRATSDDVSLHESGIEYKKNVVQ